MPEERDISRHMVLLRIKTVHVPGGTSVRDVAATLEIDDAFTASLYSNSSIGNNSYTASGGIELIVLGTETP